MVPLAGRPLFTWALEALQLAPSVDDVVVVGDSRTLRELLAASGRASSKSSRVGGGRRRANLGRARDSPRCPKGAISSRCTTARALVSVDVIERAIAAAPETQRRARRGSARGHAQTRRGRRRHGDSVARRTLVRADAAGVPARLARRGACRRRLRRHGRRGARRNGRASDARLGGDTANFKDHDGRGSRRRRGTARRTRGGRGETTVMSTRIGMGYDIHRIAVGRPLVLGGVKFERVGTRRPQRRRRAARHR